MRSTVSLRRSVGVLYAGIVVFAALAAFTARSIWTAWQERSGEERAAAVFDLVAERTPMRPTDAPGAMAWLRLELDRFGRREHGSVHATRYASFAAIGDRVPESLAPVLAVMRAQAMTGDTPLAAGDVARAVWSRPGAEQASLREQHVFDVAGHPVIVTRRKTASEAERAPSDAFIRCVAAPLVHAAAEIDRVLAAAPLPPVPGDRPPRPVRLYAVSEDATLVSAPWRDRGGPDAAVHELALLSSRPGHPAFAPQEFFFDPGPATSDPETAYSGFYLDVGGRGLVSTILVPFTTPEGRHGVLALDLAFEIAWHELVRSVAAPVIGAALDVGGSGAPSWTTFDAALPRDAPAALRAALAALAAAPAPGDNASPLRLGIVESAAVAAFQVSDRSWLVMLFPKTSPAFPFAPVALLVGVLALLFTGFERNRRRADAERRKAERAFAEKQNLLDTMQVPLVVVDPNTDVIVSSNRAAEAIGVGAGGRFADLISPDERARAYYQRMQTAPEPRRAYGVPLAIRDADGTTVERYAVVRSVAVTAQIEALAADERHRLGVLFVIDREADLGLLAADIAADARRDERRRLAGLLSHGVDALARVLEHVLRSPDRDDTREFAAWLSEYLERRLGVTAWLLDHWDATPPLAREVVIDGAQATATLARLRSVLEAARRDRSLRTRLHWDNGTLAGAGGGPVLEVLVDWPTEYVVTCPVRGGFGLFLGELITNAVRHGRSASCPRVQITCDRVRKELTLLVDNAIDERSEIAGGGVADAYGGLSIVRAMARLFEWTELACGPSGDRFVARWSMPASEAGALGDAD
jgi:PAS domain-containing protein